MVTRIVAHPMVVAVAMGLLGPDALASMPEAPRGVLPAHPDDAAADLVLQSSVLGEVTPDEIARVEREWFDLRGV
jgi:hypothetical protein